MLAGQPQNKKAMEPQVPTRPKMDSMVRDATQEVYPSPVVLCMFPNEPADGDRDRLPVFALSSEQLQKMYYIEKRPFPLNHS